MFQLEVRFQEAWPEASLRRGYEFLEFFTPDELITSRL
jgi:hypothetical protein